MMMQFYRLVDDMEVPGRWHLGEMIDESGAVVDLDGGEELGSVGIRCPVSRPGVPLDFCLTSFNGPVASKPLANWMRGIAGGDVQWLKLSIRDHVGFEGVNVLRVLDCLDESRSEYIKWTEKDHRADLAGNYRSVTRFRVDPARIPEDAHIFRIERWLIGVVVSEAMKEAMEEAGCLGAKFIEVT